METNTSNWLRIKIAILGILLVVFAASYVLPPKRAEAQSANCDESVYEYCFAQNRPVDPNTCTCNESLCLNPIWTDCAEVGNYLDPSTCTCVTNPSFIGYCDNDPYAEGCPRSFDVVFASQVRFLRGCDPERLWEPICDPMIGGGSGDICSYESVSWCTQNGGTWDSSACACDGIGDPDGTAAQKCAAAGGSWYIPTDFPLDPGVCYNPTNIGSGMECTTTSDSLMSCVASGGRWNGYQCHCYH